MKTEDRSARRRTYTHTLATSRSAAVEQGGGERKTHVLIDSFWGGRALLSHGKVLARTFEMGQVRGITPGRGNPLTSAVVVKPWAPSRVVGSRCLLRHAGARQSLWLCSGGATDPLGQGIA
ncbi:hypothetical protein MTO96_035710 [Rhipicephalus appendiculatus]